MPNAFFTLASASHAPFRSAIPRPKPAPIPSDQQKANRQARADKQAEIDTEISQLFDHIKATADQLAERFDMKARYFLDIIFQGGAHMIKHQETVNPYNAWKHKKALENQDKGIAQRADKLHEAHFAEYQELTEQEKEDMCDWFSQERAQNIVLRRDTPRGRIQDFSNTVRNLKMIINGACQRIGADSFFCLFRNNSDFFVSPEWHFSRKELEDYMPVATRKAWDTGEVGLKLEAFAIAGCDTTNLYRTAKQKADAMKGDIRALVKKSLVEVSGITDAEMAYSWYEEDVVQKYGVVMEGWVALPFANPSQFSTSLPNLRTLLDALKTGACAFRKLSLVEAAERKKKWDADVAVGIVLAKSRSERKDKGVSRKRTSTDAQLDADGPFGSDKSPAPALKRTRKEKAPTRKKTSASAKTLAKNATADGVQDDDTTCKANRRLRSRTKSRVTIEDSDDENAGSSV
ncbi:hypothetical protein K438DRAFT_1974648 [Mycena galopus ATCC 62051]|nr:hypothetical protein K438DRAFT_1974648 [Mycena galopus ATCC 62051]